MSSLPLPAMMFLLGDFFDSHPQGDAPLSVPLLAPHAGGSLSPPPLSAVQGRSAFEMGCKAVWGIEEYAIALLLLAGPAPDADE